MLENLLSKLSRHNHLLPVVDEEGQITWERARCAEVEGYYGTHLVHEVLEGGQASTAVLTCAEAENELHTLREGLLAQARIIRERDERIAALEAENAEKDEKLKDLNKLLDEILPIIFRLGPSLQEVLAEALSNPDMTDDGTGVALRATEFTLILLPRQRRALLRAVGVNVPERPFPIVNGTVDEDNQTMMLGHINRIKRAHQTGVDPVNGTIDVVRAVDA